MYSVRANRKQLTIHIRMTGYMELREMERWAREYRAATESFAAAPHLVLADMRGFKALQPAVGVLMGQTIGWARARGVYRCVHLSDSTITLLQTARLARNHSQGDDVTLNVVSMEEAQRALDELRAELDERARVGARAAG